MSSSQKVKPWTFALAKLINPTKFYLRWKTEFSPESGVSDSIYKLTRDSFCFFLCIVTALIVDALDKARRNFTQVAEEEIHENRIKR
jgi:hypothetical protein